MGFCGLLIQAKIHSAGSDLDHNCKKWRLFADILNDSALCLQLSGPLWPAWSFQVGVVVIHHLLGHNGCQGCLINEPS